MTVIKQYNTGTSAWEPIVSGVQGPTGPTGPTGAAGAAGATGAAGSFGTAQTINQISTAANYDLVASDAGKIVLIGNAANSSGQTVTINTSTALTSGQSVNFITINPVLASFVVTGVTVLSTPSSARKLRATYSGATLVCIATNFYVLLGDLIV